MSTERITLHAPFGAAAMLGLLCHLPIDRPTDLRGQVELHQTDPIHSRRAWGIIFDWARRAGWSEGDLATSEYGTLSLRRGRLGWVEILGCCRRGSKNYPDDHKLHYNLGRTGPIPPWLWIITKPTIAKLGQSAPPRPARHYQRVLFT